MVTVLLVEDHMMLSQMITRFLREQEAIEVWMNVCSAEAALNALLTVPKSGRMPDLALVDINLFGMSGIEFATELQQHYPDLPCLMISGDITRPTIQQAMAAGAMGYIAKDDALCLGEGVRSVLRGVKYMSPKIQLALVS